MQATESVPLFRTRQAAPVAVAKEAQTLAPAPTQPSSVATADDLAFTLADESPASHTDVQSPAPPQPAYDAHHDDLTSFVGLDVSDSDMATLTGRAMAYGWHLDARRVPGGWHISRLTAKP